MEYSFLRDYEHPVLNFFRSVLEERLGFVPEPSVEAACLITPFILG